MKPYSKAPQHNVNSVNWLMIGCLAGGSHDHFINPQYDSTYFYRIVSDSIHTLKPCHNVVSVRAVKWGDAALGNGKLDHSIFSSIGWMIICWECCGSDG